MKSFKQFYDDSAVSLQEKNSTCTKTTGKTSSTSKGKK